MRSTKSFTIEVCKGEDYQPIPKSEKDKIIRRIAKEIFDLAERFDGFCEIILKVELQGRGNA